MVLKKETAQKTAELLLQINAIKLQPQNPFSWASGWKSPIYCDNRLTLSYPTIRNYLRENIANQIEELYGKPDMIALVLVPWWRTTSTYHFAMCVRRQRHMEDKIRLKAI